LVRRGDCHAGFAGLDKEAAELATGMHGDIEELVA
jgi:hypothetical protein